MQGNPSYIIYQNQRITSCVATPDCHLELPNILVHNLQAY